MITQEQILGKLKVTAEEIVKEYCAKFTSEVNPKSIKSIYEFVIANYEMMGMKMGRLEADACHEAITNDLATPDLLKKVRETTYTIADGFALELLKLI